MKTVSAIIPSYNSHSTIGRTVESLLAQSEPLKEIVIVDSSDDGRTPALLDGLASEKVKVTHLPQKTTPAVGRNIGARQASGEILAFIDSDCYAESDWAKRILEANEQGCRAGGGTILLPEFQRNSMLASAQYYLQCNEFIPRGSRRETLFTPGCNTFCENALFSEIGGFPEIRASEDVLFGLEARKKAKYYLDPAIRVSHIFRTETVSFISNEKMQGRYILIYRRSHYGHWIYKGIFPLLLLPAFVLVKFLRITARILATGRLRDIGGFLGSLPLFLLGLWYWSVGFFRGCFEKEVSVA